jgi:hypothetical protein
LQKIHLIKDSPPKTFLKPNKENKIWFKKWAKYLNRHLTKRSNTDGKYTYEKISYHVSIQINANLNDDEIFGTVRMAQIQKADNIKCWWEQELLFEDGSCIPVDYSLVISSRTKYILTLQSSNPTLWCSLQACESYVHTKPSTWMFTAVLFIIS